MTRLMVAVLTVTAIASTTLLGPASSAAPAAEAGTSRTTADGIDALAGMPPKTTATVAAARSTTPSTARLPIPSTMRVATYNVCNSRCGKGRYSWSKRRLALVRTVKAENPDVLAVQEANTQRWGPGRQIDDVRRRLGAIGYRIASTRFDDCTRRCTRGAHIFFKPSKVQLAQPTGPVRAAGMRGMSTIAGTKFGRVQDRAVSWAFLSANGSRRTTLYVSVHLPTEPNRHSERLRRAVAKSLRPWADSLIRRSGLTNVELVIAGDFNSFGRRQPKGAQRLLADAGMIDGYRAPTKVNANIGTINLTPSTRRYGGFPPKPHRYGRISPARIDYVFATVLPLRHEVVIKRTKSGKFDDSYRASDHNMVVVDLPLG